jgi:uncharacterized membrane protein
MSFLRFLMLLALVIWVGGIILFAFVVAPALFSGVLPTRQLAGEVVSRVLGNLHWIGIICAGVFLLASLAWNALATGSPRPLAVKHILITLMLALTLISQFGITPRMQRLRSSLGVIDNVAPNDARRLRFDRPHQWSTRTEGTALLLGLLAIFVVAHEAGPPRRPR